MKEQKKKQNGITLIALVISIIVMLILAGVSLNMTIGDNGIITKAQEAAIQSKIAQQKEAIEHALANININTLTDDSVPEIDQIARKLVSVGAIDDYQRAKDADGNPTENVAVIVDSATRNRCFFGIKEDNKYKISRSSDGLVSAELVNEISGGDVEGLALVTKESFGEEDATGNDPNKGKFEITSDAEVMFLDPISGKLSIYVPSGVHARVSIYAKMELTNAGIKRSAIDIAEGGILDLYIDDGVEVTVNSGIGEDAQGATPGKGGYAGISVPWKDVNGDKILNDGDSYAILNLKGNGTLTAIGGKAGNGSEASYGAGGGGAGAGIGGNGGAGAYGANGYGHDNINPYTADPCADNGGAGGNCGIVNIEDKLKVFAYGGAGGSGGYGGNGSGTGGGGYPGAGIGGGGAGGAGATCCTGAGGYSAGTGPYSYMTPKNGGAGQHFNQHRSWTNNPDYGMWGAGGGYYVGMDVVDKDGESLVTKALGGFGGTSWRIPHRGGNGGIGGMGGKITKSADSKIYAFNGNKYSDGSSSNKEIDQAAIYLQAGISIKKYKVTALSSYESGTTVITPTLVEDTTYVCNTNKINYINEWYNGKTSSEKVITFNDTLKNIDMSKQGIGSGAGYVELSNGTLN